MQLYNLSDGRPAVHYRGINAIWSYVNKAYNFTFRLHGRVESHGAPNVFAVCDEIDDMLARREEAQQSVQLTAAGVESDGENQDSGGN